MDKTPVWLDTIFDTTVDTNCTNILLNQLVVKNLGFLCALLQKRMVQTDPKLRPEIIFKNIRLEVNAMDKGFKNFIIASSE